MALTKEQLAVLGLEETATEEQIGNAIADLGKTKVLLEQEKAKFKSSFDKTSSELADLKKANQAKLTDDEKKQAEIAQILEDNKTLKREVEFSKTEKAFIGAGYDTETASKLATAQLDGKADEMANLMKAHNEALLKQAKADFLKNQKTANSGDPNGGGDSKYTKENFKKGLISMEEMNRLKDSDPTLYKSILGTN